MPRWSEGYAGSIVSTRAAWLVHVPERESYIQRTDDDLPLATERINCVKRYGRGRTQGAEKHYSFAPLVSTARDGRQKLTTHVEAAIFGLFPTGKGPHYEALTRFEGSSFETGFPPRLPKPAVRLAPSRPVGSLARVDHESTSCCPTVGSSSVPSRDTLISRL